MTTHLPVVLTARDFALLESFSQNWGEPFPGAAEIMRRKLAAATLVFPADVPTDVVTLNSRVRFRVGTSVVDERTIVGGPSEEVYGLTLQLASPRGLALIGAAVGQTVEARRRGGSVEHLVIEAVPYQPEQRRSAGLTVVSSQDRPRAASPAAQPRYATAWIGSDDDPGPGAA